MPAPIYEVVVVEDEQLIRDHIIEKIQLCDPCFVVVGAASNGEQALEIVQSRTVDVVFTDIRMPVMDGLALAQKVRRGFPHVQVVIISGYADFAYAQQAIRAGVEEYLVKPINMDLLAEVLAKLKAKLGAAGSQGLHERVNDAINGNVQESPAIPQQEFMIFLLNIGNLCSSIGSAATRSFYDSLWKHFDFAALQALLPGCVAVHAPQPNARYIVWPASQADCRLTVGQALFAELAPRASGVSINLICGSVSSFEAL
jgi:two-component system response regulator YesN